MSEKVLSVRLTFKDGGTPSIERLKSELTKVATANQQTSDTAKKAAADLDAQKAAMEKLSSSLDTATTAVKAFIATWVLDKAIGGLKDLTMAGVEFNAELGRSRLGMGALIDTFGKLYDAQGNLLKGNDAFNASLTISTDLQDKLKVRALSTTLQYSQLLDVLQRGLPYMLAAFKDKNGIVASNDKLVDFTSTFAQGAVAAGLDPNEIGINIQRFLQGTADPRHARFAAQLLQTIAPTQEEARQQLQDWERQGILIDKVMEKLEPFKRLGEEAMNTYGGALSNLKDAWQQLLGTATSDATSTFTQSMLQLRDALVTIDTQGHAAFNQDLVNGIHAAANGFAYMASSLVEVVKALPEIKIQFEAVYLSAKKIADIYSDSYGNTPGWAAATIGPIAYGYLKSGSRLRNEAWTPDQIAAQLRAGQMYDQPAGPVNPASMYGSAIGPNPDPMSRYSLHGPKMPGEVDGQDKANQIAKNIEDWNALFDKAKHAAAFSGDDDPIGVMLYKMLDNRKALIDKVNDQMRKGVLPAVEGKEDLQRIKAGEADGTLDPIAAALKSAQSKGKEIAKIWSDANGEMEKDSADAAKIQIDTEQQLQDGRLSLITDAIDRELAQTLAKNQKELDDAKIKYKEEPEAYAAKVAQIQQLNDAAIAKAQHDRDKQRAGTDAWLKDLKSRIEETFPPIGISIENAIVGSLQDASGAVDQFFTKLVDGQRDIGKTLEDLGHTLGQTWAKVFADMATQSMLGKASIADQWKQLKEAVDQGSMIDKALAGAGVGAVVGGAFGGPNNKASEGGTIGGMIGAIVGSYIPGIGTMLGSVIGSALGAAIGSGLQKGKDSIKVALNNVTLGDLRGGGTTSGGTTNDDYTQVLFGDYGSLNVTEKGIDYTTRNDILVQIQRKVKETMKGYESIIKLFPDEIQKQLASFNPQLTLNGGVDSKDITDEGALSSLSDFLNNKLPEAAFKAFTPELKKAFSLEGVGSGTLDQLFAYWGTLQGQELHDAVQSYAQSLIAFQTIKGKVTGGFDAMLTDARTQASKTPLQHIQEISDQIGKVLTSIPAMADVEDKIAAQQQLTDLSTQWYNSMVQYLQQIDAITQSIHNQLDATKEQIQLAGMNPQEKIDYFYKQIALLGNQLQNTTDTTKIADLTARINAYIQQALGLAPDNKENRDKLLQILDSIGKMADQQLADAKQHAQDEQQKAAKMLQDAATALLGAADALNGGTGTGGKGGGTGGGGGGGGDKDPKNGNPINKNDIDANTSSLQAATAALNNLTTVIGNAIAPGGPMAHATSSSPTDTQRFYNDLISTFQNLELKVTDEMPLVVDNGDLGSAIETRVLRNLILYVRAHPDALSSRS